MNAYDRWLEVPYDRAAKNELLREQKLLDIEESIRLKALEYDKEALMLFNDFPCTIDGMSIAAVRAILKNDAEALLNALKPVLKRVIENAAEIDLINLEAD